MVVIKCPFRGCEYRTPDETREIVCMLLGLHQLEHQQNPGLSFHAANPNTPPPRQQRVDRSRGRTRKRRKHKQVNRLKFCNSFINKMY